MLLSRAQGPLATDSPVVRDEEGAGSNAVTPTSVLASEAVSPNQQAANKTRT